jgi:hypothetical protein
MIFNSLQYLSNGPLAEMEKGMKEVEESVEKLRRLIDESGESNKG